MVFRRISLVDVALLEAWEAFSRQALPVSWWPVSMCVEPEACLS